jgi:hypothetical protein
MPFRKSNLAASTMAKHSLNIGVNKISVVYCSNSEEFAMNESY